MSFLGQLFGGNSAAKNAAAQQAGQSQSSAGQQLATLAGQQAKTDMETASSQQPGIGRAMLAFARRGGGGAQTLGGK